METNDKIQIVAFTTNDEYETPNDYVDVYLSNTPHSILKKSKNAIAFTLILPECKKSTKVMIYTLYSLQRAYVGLKDVNCYLLFIDLEKEDSAEKFDQIIEFIKDNCEENKKLFVFGLYSEDKSNKVITEGQIIDKIKSINNDYSYNNINIDQTKIITDCFNNLLLFCTKHQRIKELEEEDDVDNDIDINEAESNSCIIF